MSCVNDQCGLNAFVDNAPFRGIIIDGAALYDRALYCIVSKYSEWAGAGFFKLLSSVKV